LAQSPLACIPRPRLPPPRALRKATTNCLVATFGPATLGIRAGCLASNWITPDGPHLAMNRVELYACPLAQGYVESSGALVVSVPRRCLARPATASPTRTTVTPASTPASTAGKAASEAGSQEDRYPHPGPGQAAAQRSSDPALDRRQGAQGERYPTPQEPTSAGGEGRLAAFQDRAFKADPGCGQPQGERPVPIGIHIMQQGAAVAGTLDRGSLLPRPGRN